MFEIGNVVKIKTSTLYTTKGGQFGIVSKIDDLNEEIYVLFSDRQEIPYGYGEVERILTEVEQAVEILANNGYKVTLEKI